MKSLKVSIGAAFLAIGIIAVPLFTQTVDTPIAPLQTEGGLIAGKVLPSGVRAWFGIPFAKAPTQDLRWKPPVVDHTYCYFCSVVVVQISSEKVPDVGDVRAVSCLKRVAAAR